MIELKEIRKDFSSGNKKLTVIERLSYTFPSQGTVAIVGDSGVGKSTLLQLLAGLFLPSSGEMNVLGHQLHTMSEEERTRFRRDSVGFIFQHHHLLSDLSAEENVALPIVIQGRGWEAARERARSLLTSLGLKERFSHRPGELSGGEQQRVAVARAFAAEPPLVLADEPTGNLDPKNAAQVEELLRSLQKETGGLVLVVTHSETLASGMETTLQMEAPGVLSQLENG